MIVYAIVPDATARAISLRTGDIDITTGLSADLIESVRTLSNVTVHETDSFSITYITLRMDQPPFDDLNVRMAVNYAIDMESIITNIVSSTRKRARNTTIPPHMFGSAASELNPIAFDLTKAKQ